MDISEEDFARVAAGAGMSYWQPIMHLDMSSPDASKRLLQLRWLGPDQVGSTIMGKLEREAKDLKSDEQDLFLRRLKIARTILKQARKTDNHWVVAIFVWVMSLEDGAEVGPGFDGSPAGHMVFSDSSVTRFVTVELAGCDCTHPETFILQRDRANQIFCLARYLGYDPKWVRCCTFGPGRKAAPYGILDDAATPQPHSDRTFQQVDSSNFCPAVPKRMAAAIEGVLDKNPAVKKSIAAHRAEAGAWRDAVMGSAPHRTSKAAPAKDARKHVPKTALEHMQRETPSGDATLPLHMDMQTLQLEEQMPGVGRPMAPNVRQQLAGDMQQRINRARDDIASGQSSGTGSSRNDGGGGGSSRNGGGGGGGGGALKLGIGGGGGGDRPRELEFQLGRADGRDVSQEDMQALAAQMASILGDDGFVVDGDTGTVTPDRATQQASPARGGSKRRKSRVCGMCGQPAARNRSGCKAVSYCGADCQRRDWPRHKAECKRLAAQR